MSIQLPPNSTGSVVDTLLPTTGKERQIVILGDPSTGTSVAEIVALVNGVYAGALVVAQPTTWSVTSTPATAVQASASKSAAGSGNQHVCQSISFALSVGSTAQTVIQVNLRDGATGAGTILWSLNVVKAANEAPTYFHAGNLNIVGSANTAMTLEFSGAGVTSSYESVSFTGYTI